MNKILCIVLLLLTACGPKGIEGRWLQPIPGMENQQQGIDLQPDGKAASVNMHTLVYENWRKEGDNLVLSGKSIGNGQTIEFEETYHIDKLTADRLVLKNGELVLAYTRARGND